MSNHSELPVPNRYLNPTFSKSIMASGKLWLIICLQIGVIQDDTPLLYMILLKIGMCFQQKFFIHEPIN